MTAREDRLLALAALAEWMERGAKIAKRVRPDYNPITHESIVRTSRLIEGAKLIRAVLATPQPAADAGDGAVAWQNFPYSVAWCDGLAATLRDCGEYVAAAQVEEIKSFMARPATTAQVSDGCNEFVQTARQGASRMKWEVFSDPSYYDMWAVRPKGDSDFNSPQLFHFATKVEADAFAALADKAKVAIPRPCHHYYGGPNGSTCYGCGKSNRAV